MTKKEMLQSIVDDWNCHELKEIHLIWTDGTKAGIGNPRAKKVVMDALREEMARQMTEC